MLHYVLVNRKLNELKSVILLNSVFVFFFRFEQDLYSSWGNQASPLATEQSTTGNAEIKLICLKCAQM